MTSWTEVPLPRATRRRRLPLRMSGLARSAGVMERMMASKRRDHVAVQRGLNLGLVGHGAHAGQHAEHLAERAHLAHLVQLFQEVVQAEGGLAELGLELFGALEIDDLFGAFDQRDHVAHAEDAGGDAVGMEDLQRLDAARRCRRI